MNYGMDAVDDIPPQLKAEIARAMDKEIDRQLDERRGRNALDLFLLFRAGLAVCREALQEQTAPIGEATQRVMAGLEIPHNEAGVPIVPAGERELNFTRQERELSEAPATWLPALLRTLVLTAREKEVFKEGGLVRFVKTVLELDGDTPIDIQSVLR